MSSIDLTSGYWQIAVLPEHVQKVAFVCPFGLYEFVRMPFGAKNSGATFQRAMDIILTGLQWSRAPTYVDNCGIWSDRDEDHVTMVEQVLERFSNAGATLNPKKCEFGCTRIHYLGFIVDRGRLHLADSRISAIRDYPEPTTAAEMQRFLGMANWCRRFIKDFGRVAGPLYEACKQPRFMMSEENRTAFERIKTAMTRPGVMKIFEFGKPLVVRTDASSDGVGAALLQEDDNGVLRVIEYASHHTNKAERNYDAQEMEALGVIYALTKWKDYLHGQRFLLQTDNRSLSWLLDKADLWGRLARWVMFLMRFQYDVEHIAGKSNVIADALSRVRAGMQHDHSCTAEDLRMAEAESFFIFPSFGHMDDVTEYPGVEVDMTAGPTFAEWQKDNEVIRAIQGLESSAGESESESDASQAEMDVAPKRPVGRPSKLIRARRPPKARPLAHQHGSDGEPVVIDPALVGSVMDVLPQITAEDQERDPDFGQIYRYLSTGEAPGSNRRRYDIVRAADDYILDGGRLWKIWIDMSGRRRRDKADRLLAVPRDHRAQLLKAAHDSRYGGGHFDFERTFANIRRHFVWPRLAQDVREYCETCDNCQRRNSGRNLRGPLEPVQIPSAKWEQVGMDIVGKLPTTPSGNCFVLVVIDYLSKWPEAICLQDQEATTIAAAFFNKIVARWGVPRVLITDQGANFASSVMAIVYRMLGVQRNPTTPLHPQSDGLVERYNRTLKATICKLAADFDAAWDQHVDWAVGNFRFTLSAALQDSPYFLMTGQDPRLPITTLTDVEAPCGREISEWKSDFFQNMQAIAAEARRAIQESQADMKIRYDRKANDHNFVPGDLVLMRERSRRPGRKLEPAFTGPYRVLRLGESSRNVLVIAMKGGTGKHVNMALLKRYRPRAELVVA